MTKQTQLEIRIDAAARVIAAYELYEFDKLPDFDPSVVRDKTAFRQIASDALLAARGNPN